MLAHDALAQAARRPVRLDDAHDVFQDEGETGFERGTHVGIDALGDAADASAAG